MKTIIPSLIIIIMILVSACTKEPANKTIPPAGNQNKEKSDSLVPLGCIRGYFGDTYLTFTQHIEQVAPVDSFSNCYFYGSCNNTGKQITLIRCDSTFVLAIYIIGFSPDSLPSVPPVPEFCKYTEIDFYSFQDWNPVSNGHYLLDDFYGKSVFITNNTDDVLTGTFGGNLTSPDGTILNVSQGEFKIKIFRKYMSCGLVNGIIEQFLPARMK